ncbi:hypothetical protein H6P81_000713 [Aristolochia fimbriata]|uniref:Uncharacterized protein n=1 Tax=Aristolochia fimbriata TaxID=158543 RepID=A0AAV7F7H6_ARIFI|nr:hypothetical protein H6P81_000713 [Aristolochia fimbriata]
MLTIKYDIKEFVRRYDLADIYRGSRRSDGMAVGRKVVHNFLTPMEEIQELERMEDAPLLDKFFDKKDEYAVIVLKSFPESAEGVVSPSGDVAVDGSC